MNEKSCIRERGKEYEIHFHGRVLAQRLEKYLEPKLLAPQFVNLLPIGKSSYHILDVGCGPISTLGTILPTGEALRITGVDPLADEYTAMLEQHGVIRPHFAQHGYAEKLDSYFEQNTFDLVFSNNALDHTDNPYESIQSMLKVCKYGSKVCFRVSCNEALNTNYVGFHQWNFTNIEETLLIWNKNRAFVLDECIGGLPYSITVTAPRSVTQKKYPFLITCVIHKINTDISSAFELTKGLYMLYNHAYRTLTLVRTDHMLNERFFVHMLYRSSIVDRLSFVWNPECPIKSLILPKGSYNGLRIGQYVPKKASRDQKNHRLWDKKFVIK